MKLYMVKVFFRVAIYIPVVIPGIAAMLMWYFMYYPDQSGLLNMILAKLGMEPYRWLNDPRFTIIGIIIYCTWKNFGGAFNSVFSLHCKVYLLKFTKQHLLMGQVHGEDSGM